LPTKAGTYRARMEIEPLWLASGSYSMDLTTSVVNVSWDHYVERALVFSVAYSNPLGHSWDFRQSYGIGSIALMLKTIPSIERLDNELSRRTVFNFN